MYLLPCLQLILPFQGGLINLRSCWRVMNRRKRAGPRLLIIRATYIAWRGAGTGINQCFEPPDNWCPNLRIWVLVLAKVFNFYHLAGLFPIFTWEGIVGKRSSLQKELAELNGIQAWPGVHPEPSLSPQFLPDGLRMTGTSGAGKGVRSRGEFSFN